VCILDGDIADSNFAATYCISVLSWQDMDHAEPLLPMQVKQEDLIGGAVVSKTAFQVWYCRHDGRKPERIIR